MYEQVNKRNGSRDISNGIEWKQNREQEEREKKYKITEMLRIHSRKSGLHHDATDYTLKKLKCLNTNIYSEW